MEVCEDIDYIFQCSGMVSAARMTVNNPMTAISTNIILNFIILEDAMKKNVKKILLFSSEMEQAIHHLIMQLRGGYV